MKYKTKIKINGAELTDEQSSSASSITGVSLEASAGNGFQVGNSAASALSVTILKPYKTSFDGDKVEFYILPDGEDDESLAEKLEEEVGSAEETEHVEDNDETDDIETEEVDDGEGEEMTAEEEAEAEAEDDIEESNLFDTMNGEEVTGEVTEEEAVPDPADWELFGVFYVYKQTNNRDGSITLRCYDGFQLLHGDYVPAIKSGTIQQFYDDIRIQCAELGVTVDPEEFAEEENVTITWNQVCSFRQAIGYIAGLVGGYATFGDDDTLGIDYYTYNDRVLLLPELLDYKTTSAGETQIDGVVCTVNLRGDTVESGDGGQSIAFYNPFATQQTVDSILEQYQGIRYIGANVKAKWDPSVRCGDLVRVMSESEYRNYVAMGNAFRNSGEKTATEVLNIKKELNAVGRTILVSSQRIDFGGETLTEITSHLPTESEKANAPTSPNDAKFRIVTAELIKTNELVAEKATIKDLEATNAEIKNIKADYVNTDTLEAEAAKIAKAEIENATIKNAQIESINGNKIVNGSIVAAALSKEVIKNFNNSNIYYQAEAPEGTELKEGDIWYKTLTKASGDRAGVIFVYDGIEWVNKPFDSESILAGSITAAEIAANTITASQINMENLQTNMARIGEATKNHVLITEKDVQIRNGKEVVASYGETINIGGETEQHVTIAKDKMTVNAGTESLFSVDSFKSGTEIISTWINTDKLTPTEDIYPEISDNIAFSVEDINNTIDIDGSYSYSFNYSFYNKGAKRVWFELENGGTITIGKSINSNSLHYEEFSNSGNEYYNGFELATSEKITRKDIIALRAAYDIEFNPAIVDIGQYRTKDIITYKGMNLYDFKALKIGSGIASENNRRDAFTVDFLGNGYFGNTLNVEQDIRAMYIGTAQVDANKIAAENISAKDISADNITMNIQRGTGKITLTTGAVEYQPRWWQCGNIVQMEVGTKCTGKVASGANIAAGKITRVPKPITESGVRAVSYYGNNANISYMGSDGTFYARNAGADALAKGNDAIGIFTYITDGFILFD